MSASSRKLKSSHDKHRPDMLEDPATATGKLSILEKDLERRQESYIARERAYKARIDELEEELANARQDKTGWMKSDSKISKLKQMQGQIINNIELVQDRTAKILQDQERDLLRAFRARLFDVQTELEKEKSKKDDGAGAWIERSRQLEAELEWAKEVADRLERVNQTLLEENARLKSQFQSQEEDRAFLIKQLVAVKKDNARLRAEYTALDSELEATKTQNERMQEEAKATNGVQKANAPSKEQSEEKYKEINVRLKRLLAEERKSLQQVRQNYALELKSRTELELLLRQCVEDVRKEIARRKVEQAQFGGAGDLTKLYARQPGAIPVEEFSHEDRERALELLLSQERVVTLLYAKTFPVATKKGGGGGGGGALDAAQGGSPSRADQDSMGAEDDAYFADLIDKAGGGISGGGTHHRPQTTSVMDKDRLPALGGGGGGGGSHSSGIDRPLTVGGK